LRRLVATCALAGAWMAPTSLGAQLFEGRVVDEEDGRPIATALVRLLTPELEALALVVADELGYYRIQVPGPGRYHLAAERIGFDPVTSHLLEVTDPEGTYSIDIGMRSVPLPLSGFVVTAERFAEIERGIAHEIGALPKSLRVPPLMRPDIEAHLDKAHNLTDVVRWSDVPSITVQETKDGPCFQWRLRQCIEVYLNGFHIDPAFVDALPLDMLETIVFVMPSESIVYGSGAVLLYTEGWIR
jgi:hypothetical protein